MSYKNKKNINFAVKGSYLNNSEFDDSQRTIKAVANTYDFYDSDGDVLRLGCAKKSISERGANSKAANKILHAKDHNLGILPGKSILELETQIDGLNVLYCESKLSETQDGESLLIKYKEGIYNQHSIGFIYTDIEYLERDADVQKWAKFIETIINPELAEKFGYGWDVKEIKLFEWSTVGMGVNSLTQFLGVKSENKDLQLQNLYLKLNALIEKAKRLDVKDKGLFEMQYKQLKQMIYEINFSEKSQVLKCIPTKTENLEDKKSLLLKLI